MFKLIQNIRKRDGRIENFDKSKIVSAIIKAMNADFINDINCAEKIADTLSNMDIPVADVEQIQNLVEVELMKSQYKNVAKTYILYRDKRNIARGRKTYDTYMSIINTIANDITKENANMNAEIKNTAMLKLNPCPTKISVINLDISFGMELLIVIFIVSNGIDN